MHRLDKADVILDQQIRGAIMTELGKKAIVPSGWDVQWHASSMIITSRDRKKILKIDAHKVYTMDVRKPDGTYKSTVFKCQSVDEAWSMASQAIKVHRSVNAIH